MEDLSWGVELWDQVDNLFKHEAEQTGLTESYLKVILDVQKLQHEYAKKLRKTVSLHLPKKRTDISDLTMNNSFANIIPQFIEMGSIQESGTIKLNESVLNKLRQEFDAEKKALDTQRSEWVKLQSNLDQTHKTLETSWQKYVFSYKEKQKAQENFQKAEKDIQMARIDVIRFKELYQSKIKQFDDAKANYANDLIKYNSANRAHYYKNLMKLLEDMESNSRSRIDSLRTVLEELAEVTSETFRKLISCNEKIAEFAKCLDSAKDSSTVIKRYQSDKQPPVDLPFFDLDNYMVNTLDFELGAMMIGVDSSKPCEQLNIVGGSSSGSIAGISVTGTLTSGLKRSGTRNPKDEYASLRSAFVCGISIKGIKYSEMTIVQVADRLNELKELNQISEKGLAGVQRLMNAYQGNPQYGEVSKVQNDYPVICKRLTSLRSHIKQLEDRFNELGGESALIKAQSLINNPVLQTRNNSTLGPIKRRTSDSFSASDSDDNFADEETNSSKIGMGNSLRNQSINLSSASTNNQISLGKSTDTKSPYVGYAKVLYEYEGDGNLYFAAKPGEIYYVLKLDSSNSGWTPVATQDGSRQGFLPTSYVDITLY